LEKHEKTSHEKIIVVLLSVCFEDAISWMEKTNEEIEAIVMDRELKYLGGFGHSDFLNFGKVHAGETEEVKKTREEMEDKLIAWTCITFLEVITGVKPLRDQVRNRNVLIVINE